MRNRANPTNVLHVTECFGGGVASAIQSYVGATPELRHHLLYDDRGAGFASEDQLSGFASVERLPRNPLSAIRAIRSSAATAEAGVIHAHSSYGGAFARLAVRAGRNMRIIYTPHGYAFERRDISAVLRAAFRAAESILAINTTLTAACAPYEAELAGRVSARVLYIPNVSNARLGSRGTRQVQPLTIVGVGRLTQQRDPVFFADMILRLKALVPGILPIWVGDGDPALRHKLEAAGVEVTGWVAVNDVATFLEGSACYAHTARWDGFPMTVLEAHAMGAPIVVRETSALGLGPDDFKATSPEAMAAIIAGMLVGPFATESSKRNHNLWEHALSENTLVMQRNRLFEAYGVMSAED